MQAIVAVDQGWGIGREGGMIYELPGDLKYFASQTRGHVVVMGRATLLSLPGGQPLKGRHNIVLTRDQGYQLPGAVVVHDLAGLAQAIAPYDSQEVFVIGGQSVYEQLIDYCDRALVTRIEAQRPADRYFPDLDNREHWSLEACGQPQRENGIDYRWCSYQNARPLPLIAAE